MRIIIAVVFTTLVNAQILVSDLVDAVNSDGILIKYLKDASVPYSGRVYNNYPNGNRELQGNYLRGLKEGKWVWWHTNGNKHKVGYYTQSIEDSLWQWWFANGQLKKRGKYLESAKGGRWIEWYDNGVLYKSYPYSNNELNGKYIEKYKNGKNKSEVLYRNNDKSGIEKFWLENGQPDYEYRWKDGAREGLQIDWGKSGLVIYKHNYINVFDKPYLSDISYCPNFYLLKKIVERNNLFVNGITTQGEFLEKLGITKRAEMLSKNLPFTKKANIYYRLKRLIDEKYMGQLFKVMFITKKKSSFNLGF